MRPVSSGALSTVGFAAHLTFKQEDLLVILSGEERPQLTVSYLSEVLTEIKTADLHEGESRYLSTSKETTYGSLLTLERRGLVQRHYDGFTNTTTWSITDKGMRAVDGPW